MVTRRDLLTLCVGAVIGGGYFTITGESDSLPGINTTALESASDAFGDNEIGDEVSRKDLTVSVTEAQTVSELTLVTKGNNVDTLSPPPNGNLVLAKLKVSNNDIKQREAPWFCLKNPRNMENGEYEYSTTDNDVLPYSGSSKGSIEVSRQAETFPIDSLKSPSGKLNPYPNSPASPPDVKAGGSIEGWVFGIAQKSETTRLRVDFGGKTSYWNLDL